jgi:hypothetical protein
MNEDRFENKMERFRDRMERKRGHGRIWTGLFLFIVGGLLLLKTINFIFFPAWFFTWPVLLIGIGMLSGIKHGFRGGFWMILILIGSLSLANHIDPSLNMDRYIWPIVIMGAGLIFILRPKKNSWRRYKDRYHGRYSFQKDNEPKTGPEQFDEETGTTDSRDFLDITAVFSGVKKNVLSKSFKGGDIVSFMGGSEIDLSQADINGRVTIDATNIFGGTKLIVPPTWDVQNDITAIFGGVDDKRQVSGVNLDPNKVLVLDGTCMFGGIEIRSF